jgi:hypothetical protein
MMRLLLVLGMAGLACAADWSAPTEVRHEDALAVAYTARVDGPYLVVKATVGQGWHTFALDNVQRVEEKLAGQPALSMDKSTEIASSGGLDVAGPWRQTTPKEFSRPELRMYSFGYDQEALFAAKVRRSGAGPAKVRVRGQACTATICKNVDVTLTVAAPAKLGTAAEANVDSLVPAR